MLTSKLKEYILTVSYYKNIYIACKKITLYIDYIWKLITLICFFLILYTDIIASDNIVNVEFNVWTKPDCGGTVYENLNRSWFFFGIYGLLINYL